MRDNELRTEECQWCGDEVYLVLLTPDEDGTFCPSCKAEIRHEEILQLFIDAVKDAAEEYLAATGELPGNCVFHLRSDGVHVDIE